MIPDCSRIYYYYDIGEVSFGFDIERKKLGFIKVHFNSQEYCEVLATLTNDNFNEIISLMSEEIPNYMITCFPKIGSFLH